MKMAGRWTPADQQESLYRYLPFEVPPGFALQVRLAYDRSDAILDLGLLDPHGFRGWSGGERDEVWITESWSTPGYIVGPVTPGTWQVMLALYRIPAGGISFEVSIELHRTPPADPFLEPLDHVCPGAALPFRELPAPAGYRWLACDFHAHSIHSDGKLTLLQLAQLARREGLDALAVTDHNTVSHHPLLAPTGAAAGLLLIPGQEVTTPAGHANCIGPVAWVDFRQHTDEWIATAGRDGGFVSLNHPTHPLYGWHRPLGRKPHAMELWHGEWDGRDLAPLEFFGETGCPVALGGSDFHSSLGATLGQPTTFVLVADAATDEHPAAVASDGPTGTASLTCPCSSQEVVAAVAAGTTALAASPRGPVALRVEDEIVVMDGEGLFLHCMEDNTKVPVHSPLASFRARESIYHLRDSTQKTYALVPR